MERSRLGPGNYSDSLEHKHQRRGTLGTLGIQRRGDGGDTLLSCLSSIYHDTLSVTLSSGPRLLHLQPPLLTLWWWTRQQQCSVIATQWALWSRGSGTWTYYTVDSRLQTDHLFSVMSNAQLFVRVLFRSVICVCLVSFVAFWHFDIMSGVGVQLTTVQCTYCSMSWSVSVRLSPCPLPECSCWCPQVGHGHSCHWSRGPADHRSWVVVSNSDSNVHWYLQ